PPRRPPLLLEDYQARSRRYKELLEERQVTSLYDVSRRYQDWLRSEGLWDDLDLAWTAFDWLSRNEGPRYTEIYCDESQDFTELDFAVLIGLTEKTPLGPRRQIGLVLAGDPLQTVHPSGFRWAMVKDRIFEAVKRECQIEISIGMSPLLENWRSDAAI